jgi:flagella basal body P-ring formation protein FlgA
MAIFRIVCICLLATLIWPGTAGALEVRFLPRAEVKGEMLTLGEIATLRPESAGKKHADLPLFQAPREGQTRVYSASTLKAYVSDALPRGTDISWAGAKEVAVREEGRLITGERVEEIVQQYLRKKTRELAVERLAFTPDRLPHPVTVPRGNLEHEVIPSNDRLIGSRYFTVRLRVDGEIVGNMTLRGQLEATAPVVVASRDMDRGTVLREKDIRVAERDITRAEGALLAVRKATGMRLKRSMDSGDILERGNLARPVLVHRGEVVTMEASKGQLLLTAKGVARSRGKKGETIKVRNTGSQREILCKVVGSGRVRVEF